jgi:hypothetical protein
MGPIQASERTSAIMLTVLMVEIGILAGAVLSFFTAYQIERRASLDSA